MQQTSIIDLVNVRELHASDLNFILSSSIKCIQSYQSKLYPGHGIRDLYVHLEKIILAAIKHPTTSIMIACDRNDSDHIIGYIMTNIKCNHIYLQYTKYAYRKLGVQKYVLMPLLIDELQPISCEWATKEMVKLVKLGKIKINGEFMESLIDSYYKEVLK